MIEFLTFFWPTALRIRYQWLELFRSLSTEVEWAPPFPFPPFPEITLFTAQYPGGRFPL